MMERLDGAYTDGPTDLTLFVPHKGASEEVRQRATEAWIAALKRWEERVLVAAFDDGLDVQPPWDEELKAYFKRMSPPMITLVRHPDGTHARWVVQL